MTSRFNHNISSTDIGQIDEYYRLRTKQLLHQGFSPKYDLNYIIMDQKRVGVVYRNHHKEWGKYVSLYIFSDYRNQGYYKRYLKENPNTTIFTIDDCEIIPWLRHNNIKHIDVGGYFNTDAYRWISSVYQDTKAVRSGQYYMNHIDEGIFIFHKLGLNGGSSKLIFDAFAIHPIFQENKNLIPTLKRNWEWDDIQVDPRAVVLAMEYRHYANAHLPKHPKKPSEEIELGPLEHEMKTMLIADKIQNCKDLELFNKKHPSYKRLEHYFHHEWFPRLGITEEFYHECVRDIEGHDI